jgi:hypothetical protein
MSTKKRWRKSGRYGLAWRINETGEFCCTVPCSTSRIGFTATRIPKGSLLTEAEGRRVG